MTNVCVVCSLAGPAHTVHGGEAHQQSSWQEQEPPEGEAEQTRAFGFGWIRLQDRCIKPRCVPTAPAQDRPPHQHLLQRSEAALAAGQRGRSAAGGAERARHVRHGGLLDHLGKTCPPPPTGLSGSDTALIRVLPLSA